MLRKKVKKQSRFNKTTFFINLLFFLREYDSIIYNGKFERGNL